jgi:hypothetical protein
VENRVPVEKIVEVPVPYEKLVTVEVQVERIVYKDRPVPVRSPFFHSPTFSLILSLSCGL